MIKIFLAISVVSNLILMAFVVGLLPLLLSLSIIIIITLVWYILNLRSELTGVSQDLEKFFMNLDDFEKHLDQIHGMEMFYGDQTLQGLMKHSREMLNSIVDFQERYFIEEEEDIDREKEDTKTPEKESLLYRSTSKSDS